MNQILCQAIPRAFADFLAGPGNGLSGHAMRFVGSEAAPRHVWQHVRSKLLESLVQVACIRTEQGAVAKPTDCLERPHHPLRMAASQLIPAKLLQLSCGRSFASSGAVATVGTGVLEVFSLKHWVKVLKYRGSSWPKGLVAVQLEDLEDPCDFFVPFGTWLDMELREAEQPSSFLAQIWELDLLPAFRSCTPTLRICDGPIFSRPCVKIRADWQGFLSEAGLLKFVEPRVRLALQNATPHLMESLTMGMPSRPELAALCISWHLTAFNGLGVTTEPMAVKAVLASLACLKETFLTDELPEGSRLAIDLPLPLPKQDPEARQAWWRELGKWLWLPSWHTVSNASTPSLRLLRPKKLRSSSYLGLFGANWKSAEPEVVQDIFAQRMWGEDILGWEAFLDAIGVREFRPAESGHGGHGELARRLGASLGSQDWWTGVLKRGLRVQAYVSRRCQRVDNSDARWLRTLPVTVEVDAPKAGHGALVRRKAWSTAFRLSGWHGGFSAQNPKLLEALAHTKATMAAKTARCFSQSDCRISSCMMLSGVNWRKFLLPWGANGSFCVMHQLQTASLSSSMMFMAVRSMAGLADSTCNTCGFLDLRGLQDRPPRINWCAAVCRISVCRLETPKLAVCSSARS